MFYKDQIKERIIEKFKEKYSGLIDKSGYLETIEDNLIQGVKIEDFKQDLQFGSGNELKRKFLAIHSSSALVVNHFSPFKNDISKSKLLSFNHFLDVTFEKKMPTRLRGTPPNLDVGIITKKDLIGIESKYLEHTERKKVSFSKSYSMNQLPYLDDNWFELIRKYTNEFMFLDVAQLIKHSIGLVK